MIASYITCSVDDTRELGSLRVAIAPNLGNGYANPRMAPAARRDFENTLRSGYAFDLSGWRNGRRTS